METVRDFASLDVERAQEKYQLRDDVRDWKVSWAQKDIKDSNCDENCACQILYHPFDKRWTYYTGKSRGFLCYPRPKVMRHMLQDNLGIILIRNMQVQGKWNHSFVCDIPITPHTVSGGVNYLFPLYRYAQDEDRKASKDTLDLLPEHDPFENTKRTENLSRKFREYIDNLYPDPVSAEDILGYIYAVLNAPSYQQRFAEFLKNDFPRIPFPEKREHLEYLAILGNRLINAHLLREFPKHKNLLQGNKENKIIGRARHDPSKNRLFINESLSLAHVTTDVWQFRIGGYWVLEKYLKDREGRSLSLDEIQTLEKTIHAIDISIDAVGEIDQMWNKAFAFGKPLPSKSG